MTRSPWHHDKRIKLSAQKTAKLFLERGGCCRECGHKFRPGDKRGWIVEHVIALENGGSNEWDNLGITCLLCKPIKDADDHGKAAESRSKAVKHYLPRNMRRSSNWPQRKFSRREAE